MNIADMNELADQMVRAQVSLVEIEEGKCRLRLAMDHPAPNSASVASHCRANVPVETASTIPSDSVGVFQRTHPSRSTLVEAGTLVGFGTPLFEMES